MNEHPVGTRGSIAAKPSTTPKAWGVIGVVITPLITEYMGAPFRHRFTGERLAVQIIEALDGRRWFLLPEDFIPFPPDIGLEENDHETRNISSDTSTAGRR